MVLYSKGRYLGLYCMDFTKMYCLSFIHFTLKIHYVKINKRMA